MAYCLTIFNDGTYETFINVPSFTDISNCQAVAVTGSEFQQIQNLITVTSVPYDVTHGAQIFAAFFLPTVFLYFSTRSAMSIFEVINKNLR